VYHRSGYGHHAAQTMRRRPRQDLRVAAGDLDDRAQGHPRLSDPCLLIPWISSIRTTRSLMLMLVLCRGSRAGGGRDPIAPHPRTRAISSSREADVPITSGEHYVRRSQPSTSRVCPTLDDLHSAGVQPYRTFSGPTARSRLVQDRAHPLQTRAGAFTNNNRPWARRRTPGGGRRAATSFEPRRVDDEYFHASSRSAPRRANTSGLRGRVRPVLCPF